MKRIETAIRINSSAEQVWNILMDFENYSEWNPFINSIKGNPNKNSLLEVELMLDQKPMMMKPKVMNYINQTHFSWLGHLFIKGLFDGHHHFEIAAFDAETVEFRHYEEFSGVFAATLLKLVGTKTKAGFEAMNKALKERVERKIEVVNS